MNADLLTEDLKRKRASNESFWLVGQPDVLVETVVDEQGADRYRYRSKASTTTTPGPATWSPGARTR